jgi:hypothetical protein
LTGVLNGMIYYVWGMNVTYGPERDKTNNTKDCSTHQLKSYIIGSTSSTLHLLAVVHIAKPTPHLKRYLYP